MQPMQGSVASVQEHAPLMLPVCALRAGPPQLAQAAMTPTMTPMDVPTTYWRTVTTPNAPAPSRLEARAGADLGASPLADATPTGATAGWRNKVCPNAPRKRDAPLTQSPTGTPMSPTDVWPSPQASPTASYIGSPMSGVIMAPEPSRFFGRLSLDLDGLSPMAAPSPLNDAFLGSPTSFVGGSPMGAMSVTAGSAPRPAPSVLNDAFIGSPTSFVGGSPVGATLGTSGTAPKASPFFMDAAPIAMLPENNHFGASFAPFDHRPRAKSDVQDLRRPLGPSNWARQLGA